MDAKWGRAVKGMVPKMVDIAGDDGWRLQERECVIRGIYCPETAGNEAASGLDGRNSCLWFRSGVLPGARDVRRSDDFRRYMPLTVDI